MRESGFSHGRCQFCKRGISDNEEAELNGELCYPCYFAFQHYKDGECVFCHGTCLLLFTLAWVDPKQDILSSSAYFQEFKFCVQCAVNKANLSEDSVMDILKKYNQGTAERILRKFGRDKI